MEALSLFDADLRPPAPAPPRPVPPRPRTPRAEPPPCRPTLLAVDGNSLAHRAFHGYAGAGDTAARARQGVDGFLRLLAAVCDVAAPDALVVGFDCRRSSERRRRWPAYKAQRPAKDPALARQLDELAALLPELGVRVVVPPGWEADDVLGSAAAAAGARGWRCVAATSDRDAFGLLDETTTVLWLRGGVANAVKMTAMRLVARVGVRAEQYVEYAALRGDASDNLPGIVGIGSARAVELLTAYPTVAEAVADPLGCRSVLGRTLGQALLDDLADATRSVFLRNVGLMTIRRDVEVEVEACRPCATARQVEERLRAWQLPGLAARLTLALVAPPDAPPPPTDADAPPAAGAAQR